jgi:probable rRNA maturation factor
VRAKRESLRLRLVVQVADDVAAGVAAIATARNTAGIVGTHGLPARSTLRRWVLRALVRDAMITLRFVGAAEGRRLNRSFRGMDYATNVLTFAYTDDADAIGPGRLIGAAGNARSVARASGAPRAPAATPLTGDIALCVPVLRREARAANKSLRAHCAHLVIHGVLHLQGYDHESAKDAKVMEALETRLLASLGYGDPYMQGNNQGNGKRE